MPSSPGLRPGRTLPPALLALGAIALWGTLGAQGVALAHVPPFVLTGLALCVGGLLALPLSQAAISQSWDVATTIITLLGVVLLMAGLVVSLSIEQRNEGQD